eukprot:GHVO01016114.1.p1 GENE.GHVO01016114.1~~GHVO01016114.1.p1  ORF type:complete len:194 (-),score=28.58 GHVO01016114.1:96-677(-)
MEEAIEKEVPNFEPSGLLAAETNTKNGVTLKYSKPVESRLPESRWRMYVFKKDADEAATTIPLHRKEWYLFGKDSRVCDIPMIHPTISKQHAVLQYRHKNADTRPYLLDLESTNGTYINGEKIDQAVYVELRSEDRVKFGKSTREYVILNETDAGDVEIAFDEFVEKAAEVRLTTKLKEVEVEMGRRNTVKYR